LQGSSFLLHSWFLNRAWKVGADKDVAAMTMKIKEAFAGALAAAGLQRVAGLGLAVPGPVDSASHEVHKCVNLGWHAPVSLAGLAAELPGQPFMWLDNDANAGAYGEATAGAGKASGRATAAAVVV
jgi:predicted NBD/HSP70 family sugar kinase